MKEETWTDSASDGIESSMPKYSFRSKLIADLAAVHGFSRDQVLDHLRTPDLARARQGVYAALRLRGWSFHRIGRAMNRHHSTVMYGYRQHRRRESEAFKC